MTGAELLRSDLRRARVDERAAATAVAPVTAFTADLYARLAAGQSGNLVCSPYSVAVALGMTVQGAAGTTASQMLTVLHAGTGTDAAARLAAGLGSLDQVLAARSGQRPAANGSPVPVQLATANSLWGQRGMPWRAGFLDVMARDFGTGMRQVDYQTATEAAREAINRWVSGRTHSRIPNLIPAGLLDAMTRLVLVNALYFKAPWVNPFDPKSTQLAPFRRLDSTTVNVPMMHDTAMSGVGYASGDGWAAVDLPYAGNELAMAVIVPAQGRFHQVEAGLDAAALARLLGSFASTSVTVGLPKWTMRTQVLLADLLKAMGMPVAFGAQADFSLMADYTRMPAQQRLAISEVVHEGFIAVDEFGTEAAAATAVVMRVLGLVAPPPSVIADRPFLYVIHDVATRTPLFIGRVTDPSAARA